MSHGRALHILEQLEALTRKVLLVFQPAFSVHSVQFGSQGRVGGDESSQEVPCRTASHNRTSGEPGALKEVTDLRDVVARNMLNFQLRS